MSHKLLGVIGVSAVLLAAPLASASAADMGMPYTKAPPPPPAVSWTGCYVDAGYGYGMWDQNQYQETFPGLVPVSANVDSGGKGWLGRFGGGCDYQLGGAGLSNWVIGAFADYDFMDIHGQMSPGNTPYIGNEKESGAWYAGGRIGYLVTPYLLTYFDGGYTRTHDDQTTLTSLPVPFIPGSTVVPAQTYSGWFIGGGTEYALNFNWLPIHGLFWRNEYRYASYGSADLPIPPGLGFAGTGMHVNSTAVQTITSSLVWRFNWPQ
jgi:outer membrane immunogenic protein